MNFVTIFTSFTPASTRYGNLKLIANWTTAGGGYRTYASWGLSAQNQWGIGWEPVANASGASPSAVSGGEKYQCWGDAIRSCTIR